MQWLRRHLRRESHPELDSLLPDLCGWGSVIILVLAAQLLATLLTLAGAGVGSGFWTSLGQVSLLVQWVALPSAGVLCTLRRWTAGQRDAVVAVLGFLCIVLVTVIVSEAAYWLSRYGALQAVFARPDHGPFVARNVAISIIVGAVGLRYLYVERQWKRNMEAESRARIEALQARIRPHFFFNSMNTIASLTRTQPARAESAVESLAQLFRATLAPGEALSTLAEETALTRRYLEIEALRLGDRLAVEWHLDGLPDETPLPALTLQPLVENAIYHGIEPRPEGGTLRLDGSCHDEAVEIAITNPLPPNPARPHREGNQMALDNTRERLKAAFGRSGSLTAGPSTDRYRVTLVVPRALTGREQ